MRISTAIVAVVVGAACSTPPPLVSPAPIPIALDGLVPVANGRIGSATFPLVIDTGTVLTSHSSRGRRTSPSRRSRSSTSLRPDRRRPSEAVFGDANVLEAPLGLVGINLGAVDLSSGGVFGGDLLQSFSVRFNYGVAPSVELRPAETACSCALADACQVVMPFTLAGGGTMQLGGNVYTYPATRVTMRACLEPVTDPFTRNVACVPGAAGLPCGYTPLGGPGVDVQLLVATGFPGVLLGAKVYDRLCTAAPVEVQCMRSDKMRQHLSMCSAAPTAKALLAGLGSAPLVDLHFADGSTVTAAQVLLGDPASDRALPLAAMAIVGREALLGPCAELARSRRLRAAPPTIGSCDNASATDLTKNTCLQVLPSGGGCGDPNHCDDRTEPAAGFVEIDDPVPVYVVDDAAPVLQAIKNDVQPALPAVEGIVGTELLARMRTQIDYANRRVLASCASSSGCLAFPRYACATGQTAVGDCGQNGGAAGELCNDPSTLCAAKALARACLPAPVDYTPDITAALASCTR